jgi:2-methylisocitrate lyase-like PEP mutase family enzyme
MNQVQQAARFTELHAADSPLVLYNAWDAGSARAIEKAGAAAIATSSWAMAAAHGYEDGEQMPFEWLEQIVGRMVAAVELPVTVDFEGGYAEDHDGLASHLRRLLDLGVVGINFEDRVVAGSGLYDIEVQAGRIATLRRAADDHGVALFINARTDLFLAESKHSAELLRAAEQRTMAYAEAGASGIFVPGLCDAALIEGLCASSPLPVNVMVIEGIPEMEQLAAMGVARISHGPGAYIQAASTLTDVARRLVQPATGTALARLG